MLRQPSRAVSGLKASPPVPVAPVVPVLVEAPIVAFPVEGCLAEG